MMDVLEQLTHYSVTKGSSEETVCAMTTTRQDSGTCGKSKMTLPHGRMYSRQYGKDLRLIRQEIQVRYTNNATLIDV